MYTLCTLNEKELDTGHNPSTNSELSYASFNVAHSTLIYSWVEEFMFILSAASIIITISSYLMKILGEESNKQSEVSQISSYICHSVLCLI